MIPVMAAEGGVHQACGFWKEAERKQFRDGMYKLVFGSTSGPSGCSGIFDAIIYYLNQETDSGTGLRGLT